MDKEGFKKFLLARGVRAGTKGYINAVKTFEKWLFNRWEKTLDEANESDLRACEKLTRNPLYAYGVREYYRYLGKDKMVETINSEIIPKLPVFRPTLGLLSWSIYDDILEKVKEKGVSYEKLTLLNLLWSEMKPTDILQLRKSDVDLERLVITTRTSGEFRVTPKAWDALRQYIADMSKRQKLFTMGIRNLQTLTKKLVGYTPRMIRNSCKDDLLDAGRKARFSHQPHEKTTLEEEEAEEQLSKASN